MKTPISITSKILILLLATFSIFGLQSCKNEGCTNPEAINYDPDAVDDDGTCSLKPGMMAHFHSKFGTEDFAFNQDFQFSSGRTIQFTLAQFYVSGMQLPNDGAGFDFTDQYLLVKADQMMYDLGTIEVEHYHGITFDVGVDSASNHNDPSTYESSHVLSPQSPTMHWSWNSGYQFIKIEGLADTSATGNGTADFAFELHVGMDAMLRNVSLTSHFEAEADKSHMISIEIDWARFFDNIDMTTDFTTHTMDNMPVAMQVANSVTSAVTLQ